MPRNGLLTTYTCTGVAFHGHSLLDGFITTVQRVRVNSYDCTFISCHAFMCAFLVFTMYVFYEICFVRNDEINKLLLQVVHRFLRPLCRRIRCALRTTSSLLINWGVFRGMNKSRWSIFTEIWLSKSRRPLSTPVNFLVAQYGLKIAALCEKDIGKIQFKVLVSWQQFSSLAITGRTVGVEIRG